jgi:hypothetical protein
MDDNTLLDNFGKWGKRIFEIGHKYDVPTKELMAGCFGIAIALKFKERNPNCTEEEFGQRMAGAFLAEMKFVDEPLSGKVQ